MIVKKLDRWSITMGKAMEKKKIRIGISACLLGDNVRYDGGNKLDQWIVETLGNHVEFVKLCPECECGLPCPRPPMNLAGTHDSPKLIVTESDQDLTNQLTDWVINKVNQLPQENLDGFIFKSKSPSCGIKNIEYFSDDHQKILHKGQGIFAKFFIERFPHLPITDEQEINQTELRDKFLKAINLQLPS